MLAPFLQLSVTDSEWSVLITPKYPTHIFPREPYVAMPRTLEDNRPELGINVRVPVFARILATMNDHRHVRK